VVDGKGGWYDTSIIDAKISDCKLKIRNQKTNFGLEDHYIHIVMAPPKSHDRTEWFVEKAVELGVQEISFIFSSNSERRDIKMNRLKKTALTSMKQSLKAYLPQINKIISLKDFVVNCANEEKYIGYLGDIESTLLFHAAMPESNYCVLIGPEGGYSLREINNAKKYGFTPISLGSCRLRTETAGIAACHILNIINGK